MKDRRVGPSVKLNYIDSINKICTFKFTGSHPSNSTVLCRFELNGRLKVSLLKKRLINPVSIFLCISDEKRMLNIISADKVSLEYLWSSQKKTTYTVGYSVICTSKRYYRAPTNHSGWLQEKISQQRMNVFLVLQKKFSHIACILFHFVVWSNFATFFLLFCCFSLVKHVRIQKIKHWINKMTVRLGAAYNFVQSRKWCP